MTKSVKGYICNKKHSWKLRFIQLLLFYLTQLFDKQLQSVIKFY